MNNKAYLFVNLGTPAAPTTPAVRKYLQEFLMDDEVIDIPAPLRLALVYGIISPFRAPKSAHAYQTIWTVQGSPLLQISQSFMSRLREQSPDPDSLFFACRYGQPSLVKALREISSRGYKELHLFPLYPQFATSTWVTLQKRVVKLLQKLGMRLRVTIQKPYFHQAEYIKALAATVQAAREGHEHLMFSFHGIPVRQCVKPVVQQKCQFDASCCYNLKSQDDFCYRSHCLWTARLVAEELQLTEGQWSVAFQSRLGRAKWLEPYATDHIDRLLAQGQKKIAVICPSFVADCLETLEEINIQLRAQFMEHGGEHMTLIPCLNDSSPWIAACDRLYRDEDRHDLFVNTNV